jgi:hypothetical protein
VAWFHFCTANHNEVGRSTLVDMANWFAAGLLDLGHKVTFSDSYVESGALNVFWDRFRPQMREELAKAGIAYGIVATEIPDGHAFNWRKEPEWKERFDAFHDMARGASFIWTMVESTLPFYSQFCGTSYMELGFSERLIPSQTFSQHDYDFSFFGLRTPYREQLVERLRTYARVEWPENFLSPHEVAELIGRSKIGLSFRQSEVWPIPSPTRLGRLMMAKRGVAAEYVPVATKQGEIAGICPQSSDFAEYALEMLNSDWKQRAESVFDAYRDKMPMRDIMQRVLDQTVDGLQPSRPRTSAPVAQLAISRQSWNIARMVRNIGTRLQRKQPAGEASIRTDLTAAMGDPPILIDTVGSYNIVYFRRKFIAIPQSFGTIDLVHFDLKTLPYIFESRAELNAALSQTGMSRSSADEP